MGQLLFPYRASDKFAKIEGIRDEYFFMALYMNIYTVLINFLNMVFILIYCISIFRTFLKKHTILFLRKA